MGKKKADTKRPIESYEHRDKRRVNNPPVGLVTPETDPDAGQKKKTYAYDPHLDPALSWDQQIGRKDIEERYAQVRALTGAAEEAFLELARERQGGAAEEELKYLEQKASELIRQASQAAAALEKLQLPHLQWAGKAEHTSFEVPTVSLHVHERIDPCTIIEAVRKRNGNGKQEQLPLFEVERQEPFRQAIEFYQHKHGWSNRLIAGDSLLVMNSLLEKEGMAGKVQMIYIDPPYGIKYGSNFQPFVNRRDVKDGKDEDLTAEPEQIRAFRDTWELGIHSYLTYLRDRLLLARELLTESGSVFVQISDENVHHVRELMDEVFGAANFAGLITVRKTGGLGSAGLTAIADFIVWYAKDKVRLKYRQLYLDKADSGVAEQYRYARLQNGKDIAIGEGQELPNDAQVFQPTALHTMFAGVESCLYDFELEGKRFSLPPNRQWSTTKPNMMRLATAGRIYTSGKTPRFIRYLDDFPVASITTLWADVMGSDDKTYVVQTSSKIIERCLLMTTDPGDLVFDPTCGSGTTAYVAEQWGRRWITCDTSRVALALARQRLMTAVFDYYELAHPEEGVGSGFRYKTVPHVTLKSIANNPEIDGIHARWTKKIEQFLVSSFEFLDGERVRQHLERAEFGLLEQYIDDAAHADPELKTKNSKLKTLLAQRREEIDAAIARHAPQETLYDQPFVDRKKTRVSGPFTVEAVPAPAVKSVEDILESGTGFQPVGHGQDAHATSADASIARSGETLRQGEWRDELLRTGIRGKAGQYIRFSRLEPLPGCRWLHADGETRPNDEGRDRVREGAAAEAQRVVVSFGPEHALLEQRQVEHAWEEARTLIPKPKLLVFAAFQFDPEAAKDIDELKPEQVGMQLLKVQMNADLLTDDLKKKRASNESFWLIGQPDVVVSSFEFLVFSDGGRRIAAYGTFKELSGLGSLEEIHRLSWQDLFLYALLSQGRDVWAYLANQEGWDFYRGQHSRGSGQKQQGRVPPVSWNSPGIVGGIRDLAHDLAEFGVSDLDGCRRIVERLRGSREIVGGLETVAQRLNFPVPPSTKNWQLKTKNLHCVAVHGFDYYNTKTGGIESGGSDKVKVWMLDTDYDGRSLYPRQVFFPMDGENEGWARLAKSLKAEIDEDLIEAYRGTVSLPFEAGEHRRIAVKIVDDRGIESLKIIEVESTPRETR